MMSERVFRDVTEPSFGVVKQHGLSPKFFIERHTFVFGDFLWRLLHVRHCCVGVKEINFLIDAPAFDIRTPNFDKLYQLGLKRKLKLHVFFPGSEHHVGVDSVTGSQNVMIAHERYDRIHVFRVV
jgi:hypothetical protein